MYTANFQTVLLPKYGSKISYYNSLACPVQNPLTLWLAIVIPYVYRT